MNDLISKDAKIEELIKQRYMLERQLGNIRRKISLRIEKIIASKLKTALAAHKWRVAHAQGDFYENSDRISKELWFEIVEEGIRGGNSIILHKTFAAKSLATPLKNKYGLNKKTKKLNRSRATISIKNFRDIYSLCERWDTDSIKYGNVFISFTYNRMRISSALDNIDDIYAAVKKLEIPIDLSAQISDIEKFESDLKKRKELMHDLSSRSLFAI